MKSLLRQPEVVSMAAVMVLILAVLPLTLDPFRLNLVGKYMSFAFVAIGIVILLGLVSGTLWIAWRLLSARFGG